MASVEKERIRAQLSGLRGCSVDFFAVGERNRITREQGVLAGVYPDIFMITVARAGYTQNYCYSYHDIMTKKVKVTASAN